MLRLALIGCGAHAETAHAQPLAHYAVLYPGEIALVAACDLNIERARRFCKEYGFGTAYTDFREMLDVEKPDAALAIVPIAATAEVGGELLRRSIPCVLEKPPGRDLSEAKCLAEVARCTGTPHIVSMNRRFSPFLNRARTWAQRAGDVRYIHAQMTRRARTESEFLWGTGVHVLDAVRYLGGDVSTWQSHRIEEVGQEAAWFRISLTFGSGCQACVEILPTAGVVEERYELFGEGFQARAVTMGDAGESVRCWKNGALDVDERAPQGAPLFLRDGSYEETTAFIRALCDGMRLQPTLEDVIPSLVVATPPTRAS